MMHSVTPLLGGKPVRDQHQGRPCLCCGRPFETYTDQPDTAERVRLDVQRYPFALPEKRDE